MILQHDSEKTNTFLYKNKVTMKINFTTDEQKIQFTYFWCLPILYKNIKLFYRLYMVPNNIGNLLYD